MRTVTVAALALLVVSSTFAAGPRLVVTDQRPGSGKVKTTWRLDADVLPVSKGAGVDRGAIAATLHVAVGGVHGALDAPAGAFDGLAGWVEATPVRARHKSKVPAAPVRSLVIREGKRARLVGGNPGDAFLDALTTGPLHITLRVENGPETIDHCVVYPTCRLRAFASGGRQLDCRDGVVDASCAALPAVCGNGVREAGEPCDGGAYCTPGCQLPSLSPGCCQAASSCRAADGFSLNFNLLQACGGLGGDLAVPGGVCSTGGACEILTVDPVPLCCQLAGSCTGGSATSTQALWNFRNLCTGAQSGTVVPGAVCGTGGTCQPG